MPLFSDLRPDHARPILESVILEKDLSATNEGTRKTLEAVIIDPFKVVYIIM